MESIETGKALSAAQRLAYLLFLVLLASSLCFPRPVVSGETGTPRAAHVEAFAAE